MAAKAPRIIDTAVARLKTDEQSARKIAALFAECFAADDIAVSLVDDGGGRWMVAVHFPAAPDEQAVRALTAAAAGSSAAKALTFERVAATDWVRESLAGLEPVRAGRFVVHGAHDRARVPLNRIGIEIEASLAFGTGHHGTTRGCLLALDALCKALASPSPCKGEGRGGGQWRKRRHSPNTPPHPEVRAKRASKDAGRGIRAGALRGSAQSAEHVRARRHGPRILDLGTGSGVLAVAAARALRRRVLATDIDAEAVRVARANAAHNGAGALIEFARADGVARQRLRARAPFDLVFANILLGPLQRFAAALIKLTAPGGRIILSGILPAQANAAISAYRPLALERRGDLDGWTTLVFVRRGS